VATLAAFAIRVGSAQRHAADFALIGDRALAFSHDRKRMADTPAGHAPR